MNLILLHTNPSTMVKNAMLESIRRSQGKKQTNKKTIRFILDNAQVPLVFLVPLFSIFIMLLLSA